MNFHPHPVPKPRQIPIIALIDILVILLLFFIVNTTFKKKRHVLNIDLPVSKSTPTRVEVGESSVLAVDAEGKMVLDGVEVMKESLTGYLEAFQRINPGRQLELEADEEVSFRILFVVWDALIAAGIEPKEVPTRVRKGEKQVID